MREYWLHLLTYLLVVIVGCVANGALAQQAVERPNLSPPPREVFDSASQVSISIDAEYEREVPSTIVLRLTNHSQDSLTFRHRNGIVGPFVVALRHKREWLIDMDRLDRFSESEGYPETSEFVLQPGETKVWRANVADLLASDVDINAIPNPNEILIHANSSGLYIQDEESEYADWPFKPFRYSVGIWE